MELSYPALTLFIASDLGIPVAEAVAIGLPLYLLMGLFAVPWGVISDRIGNLYSQALACFLSAIGSLGLAFTESLSGMFICLTLIGAGIAAFHPAGMGAISSNFVERRGKALAIHGIWGGVGIVGAPLIAGFVAYAFSWRTFYILSGLFAIAVGIWSYMLYFSWEKKQTRDKEKESKTISKYISDLVKIFKYREFFLLICCMTIGGFVYRANSIAIPLRLKEASGELLLKVSSAIESLGLSGAIETSNPLDAGSAFLVALAFLGGILGQFLGGSLADKYRLEKVYFFYFLSAIPCLLAVAFLQGSPLVTFAMAYMFFGLGMQPVENSLVAKLSPPEILSSVYGLKFLFAFGIGALAVYPTSFFTDRDLVSSVYLMLCGVLILHIFLVSRMKDFKTHK